MTEGERKMNLERTKASLRKIQKSLLRMNAFCVFASGLMWIVSMFASVKDALKHGAFWEVVQIVDGVQTVTTRNTFFNLGVSAMFLFMALTSILSFGFLFVSYHSNEDGSFGR